jgi:small subunit ribosomal protein S18
VKPVSAKKKRRRFLMRRKRTIDPNIVLDYKNPDILKRFITDRGKIIPRRISGATADQQRSITVAVKRARYLSLLPYSMAHRPERGFAGEMQMVAQSFGTASFRGRRDGGPRGDRPSGDRFAPRDRAPAVESQEETGGDDE